MLRCVGTYPAVGSPQTQVVRTPYAIQWEGLEPIPQGYLGTTIFHRVNTPQLLI